jgi:hypothetical protein
MKKLWFCVIVYVYIFVSCTEKFEVNFSKNEPKLVVECALLDIDSLHYLKLNLSKSSFSDSELDTTSFGVVNEFKPVKNAIVIISDDLGNIDTLSPVPDSIYLFFEAESGRDSILIVNDVFYSKGNYMTDNIRVSAGNTYFLKILWNNREYDASCLAPQVPKIDTITYDYAYNQIKNEHYYIPYIWFTDNPNTVDYYLFKTNLGSGVWSRSILSDQFLGDIVNGIDVFKGESVDYWRNAYPNEAYAGLTYRIEMHSITKQIYEYYRGLIAQFRNDGGIYSPTPSSPPSNISNGALGFFRASCVQVVEETLPYPPN